MDPTTRLPDRVLEVLRAQASGEQVPADPRPAASVVLVRDGVRAVPDRAPATGETSIEVHLLVRAASMAFAPGRGVFPGGGVDPGDRDPVGDWVGPSASEWAARLDLPREEARARVVAAARETFEECGVLLADHADGTPLEDPDGAQWELDRRRVAEHDLSLAQLLADRGLRLRTDLLRPWALWVTPVYEPRRYHTWFFLARLPAGQSTRAGAREAISSTWYPVPEALRAADRGDLKVLRPQYCTFLELFGAADVEDLFARPRDPLRVRGTVAFDADGAYLALPPGLVELGRRVGAHMYPAAPGRA